MIKKLLVILLISLLGFLDIRIVGLVFIAFGVQILAKEYKFTRES